MFLLRFNGSKRRRKKSAAPCKHADKESSFVPICVGHRRSLLHILLQRIKEKQELKY